MDIAAAWAAGHLDDGDAVLIVDETADEKSSADCAGAARQYSGTLGGIALCQVAVTVTYATSRGHALIGRALYLPEGCAADEEHRELAGVPEEVLFATKPQLAGALLDRAHAWGSTPPSWRLMRYTAGVNCAAASAGAGWAMCWRSARTMSLPLARAVP